MGPGEPLDEARRHAAADGVVVDDEHAARGGRRRGVVGHRLEVGGNADLVVHHRDSLREVLGHHEAPAYVVASGRLVASSTSSTTFHLEQENS